MLHPDGQATAERALRLPEIVALPAEIDIGNGEVVGRELLAALRPGVSVIIADMSATEFVDSSAIRHLIIAHNQAVCTGAELRIVISSPAVQRILHLVGADQMLRLYPDMNSALTGAPQSSEQGGP